MKLAPNPGGFFVETSKGGESLKIEVSPLGFYFLVLSCNRHVTQDVIRREC
jgi:hypothetical protein